MNNPHKNRHGGKRLGSGRKHRNGIQRLLRKEIGFKASTVNSVSRRGCFGTRVRELVEAAERVDADELTTALEILNRMAVSISTVTRMLEKIGGDER